MVKPLGVAPAAAGAIVWALLAACTVSPAAPAATATPAGAMPATATAALSAATQPPATAVTGTAIASPTEAPPSPSPSPAAAPDCQEPGVVAAMAIPSAAAGTLAYRVYLPPCYGQDGRVYPTLYLLPGSIHNEAIWDELGIDETAEAGIAAGLYPPLLIVMADGGRIASETSGGPGSYESVVIEDLLAHVEATLCAWPAVPGRAIGGLSRGGYWALEIAFRHPDLFGSAGGHSAALLDVAAGPDIDPQQTALARDLSGLRIYLDVGDADFVMPRLRALHESLAAAVPPVEHTWTLNEGDHVEAYWRAHLADYLQWYSAPWSLNREDYPMCALPNPSP